MGQFALMFSSSCAIWDLSMAAATIYEYKSKRERHFSKTAAYPSIYSMSTVLGNCKWWVCYASASRKDFEPNYGREGTERLSHSVPQFVKGVAMNLAQSQIDHHELSWKLCEWILSLNLAFNNILKWTALPEICKLKNKMFPWDISSTHFRRIVIIVSL